MKESVLEFGSSIPPLQSDGGALVYDPADNAAILSNFFDRKQSREVVDCPVSCHRRTKLNIFAVKLVCCFQCLVLMGELNRLNNFLFILGISSFLVLGSA